jgi:hypothetical protein
MRRNGFVELGDFEDAIMNCKPGDLAIITNSLPSGMLCGRIVRVVRQRTAGEVFTATDGNQYRGTEQEFCWVIEADEPITWCGRLFYQRPFADKWLRPITGLPVTDEVTDDIKEPA